MSHSRPDAPSNGATSRPLAAEVSGAARPRRVRGGPSPRRRGRRWPRPRSASGRRPGTAARAPATCGPRRSAGRCRRRTAARPRAVRPAPSRTASITACAATSSADDQATSWNTAGNGDTRGAGSIPRSGPRRGRVRPRMCPSAGPRVRRPRDAAARRDPTTVAPTNTSAHRPGCHGRCCAAPQGDLHAGRAATVRTASNASAASTGTPWSPGTAGFTQAGQDDADVLRLVWQRCVERGDLVHRSAGDRLGCVRTPRVCSVRCTTWAMANSAVSTLPRDTLRTNASSSPGSSVEASCGRSAFQRVEHHVGVRAARVIERQAPGVEVPGRQEGCRQDLDVSVDSASDFPIARRRFCTAVRPRPAGREYRGINIFILASSPYSSPYWMTFNQIQSKGGHVIKGEKSMPVIFWKWLDKKDDDPGTGKIPMLRYYNVFNLDQTEGIIAPDPEETTTDHQPLPLPEEVFKNMPLRPELKFGGNRAYYSANTWIMCNYLTSAALKPQKSITTHFSMK